MPWESFSIFNFAVLFDSNAVLTALLRLLWQFPALLVPKTLFLEHFVILHNKKQVCYWNKLKEIDVNPREIQETQKH